MNSLYFGNCLDVLKELNNENNINLDVANCNIKFKKFPISFGEGAGGEVPMLTFKSATKRFYKENPEDELKLDC